MGIGKYLLAVVAGISVCLFSVTDMAAQEKGADKIFMTRTGTISFFSSTPVEDIEAVNKSVTCILKAPGGELAFKLFMKSFSFERAAMQDHFNKDYVHSDEFPNATFEGKIRGMENIDVSADGVHEVEVEGALTIHGITRPVTAKGTLGIKKGQLVLYSKFSVLLSDYNVKVPTNFVKNINKEISITVNASLEPYER
jgi:hypothetical protein